ncbi:hypothetical protein CoNPh27_CDS0006 [Staphylococcus phage S-CoN_Ph27]|nr:hypothetical protein CoNPh27_CDS0006 [Staphylococcus phage S-CoN_Ph27]
MNVISSVSVTFIFVNFSHIITSYAFIFRNLGVF